MSEWDQFPVADGEANPWDQFPEFTGFPEMRFTAVEKAPPAPEALTAALELRKPPEPSQALRTANAASGAFVDGIPVAGPLLKAGAEKAAAGIRSLMSGNSFDDELQAVQQFAQQNRKENPVTDTVAGVAGSVAGTAPMLMAAPAAFGVQGATMLGRSAAAALSGAALGGSDAAVRSGGDVNEAVSGAVVGGMLGGAAPKAGELLGRGASNVTQWFLAR